MNMVLLFKKGKTLHSPTEKKTDILSHKPLNLATLNRKYLSQR